MLRLALSALACLSLGACITAEERQQRTALAIQQCQAYGFTDQNMVALCAMQIVEGEARERRARLRRVGEAIGDGMLAAGAAQQSVAQPQSTTVNCRTISLGQGLSRTTCN